MECDILCDDEIDESEIEDDEIEFDEFDECEFDDDHEIGCDILGKISMKKWIKKSEIKLLQFVFCFVKLPLKPAQHEHR